MARPRQAVTKTAKIETNITDDEKQVWLQACEAAGIQPAHTLRQLVDALVRHVAKHGKVEQPIELKPPTKHSAE